MLKTNNNKQVLSENFSDNNKRRRGRPKVFSEETEAILEACGVFKDLHSRRGRVNNMNRTLAITELGGVREFIWLVDEDACTRGDKGAWKPTILAELGRVKNPEEMRDIARQICKLKPKVREAVVLIRRYRVGQNIPKEDQLEDEICNLLEDFRARYPKTSSQEFIDAMDFCKEVIKSLST